MRRLVPYLAVAVVLTGLATLPRKLTSRPALSPDFTHFESAHVHPIDITPSRDRLLVVNTADNRLSVFDITGATPVRIAEVPVGLEPISVRARDDSTAWVVNQISDDVSVVNLNTMHTRATIRTGDEPMDVIFAGAPERAYVSVSMEDAIKAYDPSSLALVATIPVNGHRPRSLAKSTDGTKVYAAIMDAGNRTSVIPAARMSPDSMPQMLGQFGVGGDSEFPRDPGLPARPPRIGLIVRYATDQKWYDLWGNNWTHKIGYQPFEVDVAVIGTATNTVVNKYGDLGSHHLAITVNPFDGRLAVVGTLGRNEQRFEPRINGYVVEQNLYLISTAGVKLIRVLNPQTNFFSLPGTQAEIDSALGFTTGIAADVNATGDTARLYVTSLATNRLGVLNPNSGGAASMVKGRVPTVEGPTGVAVDRARNRIFVVGRFRNQLQTMNLSTFASLDVSSIGFDPTPDDIVNGRRFMYAGTTSAHGDQSCASCHLFGDTDNLSWDLGDPLGSFIPAGGPLEGFDPEKGPMMTQSLRGHINTGPLHWRGDRPNFAAFNNAFLTILGRNDALPDSQMSAFDDFTAALVYPPNPNQNLDRSFPDAPPGQPSARRGENIFMNYPSGPTGQTCNSCHTAANFGPGTSGAMIADDAMPHNRDLTPRVVISQVYGGGGNSGATLKNDFIEIFNAGATAISVNGWSVQYAAATSGTWTSTPISGTIAAGGYYLVQEAAGTGGTVNLPTPNAVGSIAMSATAAKVALVNSTTLLAGTCPADSSIQDLIGYGAANCSEGTPAQTLSNTTSASRDNGGCGDTGDNLTDFSLSIPTPRNSGTPANPCLRPPEDQDLKVPQLRNLYTKLGFKDSTGNFNKRMFGYGHDGATDNLWTFLSTPGITLGGTQAEADANRADLIAYLLAFDTGMAPAVGHEVTFDGSNNNAPGPVATLDSLVSQASLGYCDLVAHGRINGQERGFLFSGGTWQPDRAAEAPLTTATLRGLGAAGGELTARGVPPGSGTRMGIDRDRDTYLDRDEADAGSDPGDPASIPAVTGVEPPRGAYAMLGMSPNPFRQGAEIRFSIGHRGAVDAAVYDIMGREVRRLAERTVFEAGPQVLRWDGRNAHGRPVGAGVYFVRVRTEAVTWNRTLVRLR